MPRKERAYSGHVPYYRKRQNRSIQLQIGRGGEIVERKVGTRFRSQYRGAGGQPDVG